VTLYFTFVWGQLTLFAFLMKTQFGVDFALWDSEIGESASKLSDLEDWRIMAGSNGDKAPIDKLPRHRKTQIAIEKKVQEWIKGTDKPTLQSLVRISTRDMQGRWRDAAADAHNEDETVQSCETNQSNGLMQKVHEASQQLRACYTDMAIEKACLQLSVALLDLASEPSCHNPFLCLQQAAIFASQGCKAGNSDLVFRNSIPEEKACTPLEALVILGRADCLQSIYFPNEAAFLCSYIGRVCSLHRDRQLPDLEWNEKWRIVAIYAYNVSVMIRATVSTVLDKEMQKSFLSMWERDVVEELERGRIDAVAWKRSLPTRLTLDDSRPGEDIIVPCIDEGKDEIDKDDDGSATDDEEEQSDDGYCEEDGRTGNIHSIDHASGSDDELDSASEGSDVEQGNKFVSVRSGSEHPLPADPTKSNSLVDVVQCPVVAWADPGHREEQSDSDDSIAQITVFSV
jgi:hypothetical protein